MRRTRGNQATAAAIQPAVRCAVYTRKSTDEGLQRDFNSLDNQRERAEAYIDSQRDQGWVIHSGRYDDGGFSGGNTDRPALKRLLADVEAGLIDTVVVYKLDRCAHEGECRKVCEVPHVLEMTIKGRAEDVKVDVGPDCTRCGMCVDACPTRSLDFEIKGLSQLL